MRVPRLRRPTAENPWPSFTDLLGAFVLVIFLGLLFFVLNFRQAESEVLSQRKELKRQEKILLRIRQEIQDKRQKLREERRANRRLIADLREAQTRAQKALGAKAFLERVLERVKKERMEIERARARAEAALARAEASRQECQRKIEAYIGVRRRIMKRIFTGLRGRLQDPQQIRFDKKGGSILLGANVLFRAGRWKLQSAGKANLRTVWQAIRKVIESPLNRPYIAGIVVEGYTSSEGVEAANWKLSARRALAALNYLLGLGADRWSKKGLIAATGYGPTRTIRRADGLEDRVASRRIEIRILFRDREQIERLARELQLLDGSRPASRPSKER